MSTNAQSSGLPRSRQSGNVESPHTIPLQAERFTKLWGNIEIIYKHTYVTTI